ncbi:OmpA family protein (plasmid) [Photobacterium sp. GJ3]|uniref:OmpA family protein n=1 Tax=Photobacterium sp. GJ3 TaxID=2829502 RepID=UPI001B8D4CBC|nr:OmpA family protein [Photobacterium sp. GJ3]QUJ69401.1 OmpA family protein [Photobacterium sp. GJ3]
MTRTQHMLCLLMFLLPLGCATTVGDPPVAEQSRDLLDQDSDGVINARERCADTPLPAIVNNDGCPAYVASERTNELHILFANDSDVIPDAFRSQIIKMANFLKHYPETAIELKGYASPVGGASHNQDLSQRRAANVRQLLLAQGIAPARVRTVGFGDHDPVQGQTREQTNILSRRVTATVTGADQGVLERWTIFTTRSQ